MLLVPLHNLTSNDSSKSPPFQTDFKCRTKKRRNLSTALTWRDVVVVYDVFIVTRKSFQFDSVRVVVVVVVVMVFFSSYSTQRLRWLISHFVELGTLPPSLSLSLSPLSLSLLFFLYFAHSAAADAAAADEKEKAWRNVRAAKSRLIGRLLHNNQHHFLYKKPNNHICSLSLSLRASPHVGIFVR